MRQQLMTSGASRLGAEWGDRTDEGLIRALKEERDMAVRGREKAETAVTDAWRDRDAMERARTKDREDHDTQRDTCLGQIRDIENSKGVEVKRELVERLSGRYDSDLDLTIIDDTLSRCSVQF